MIYIVLSAAFLGMSLLYLRHASQRKQRKELNDLRLAWGAKKVQALYFNRIGKYAAMPDGKHFHQLSDQTRNDIDFDELFSFLDRTTSRVGQQVLYKKLLEPTQNIETLKVLSASADLFANDDKLRETVQQELLKLSDSDAYYICDLMQAALLHRPEWMRFLPLNILLIFILLGSSLISPAALILLIVPLSISTLIHYWNKTNTFQLIQSFAQMRILLSVSGTISKRPVFRNPSVDRNLATLAPVQRQLAWFNFGNHGGVKDDLSQVVSYLLELLRGFFMIEVFMLYYLTKELEAKKESIKNIFKYIGEIDVALSIASLRAGSLTTCRPEFVSAGKELVVSEIYHPLIKDCVKNDFRIHLKDILITGSNMSGKSTFLRTVMINSILSQTIFTCFAGQFKSPILKQFSSIRIDDSLWEGKSYFFEEVNVMSSLLEESESDDQNLFVVDEPFRGTNRVERTASAKAILSYLNRKHNIVIISTHDLDLSALLEGQYELYHFSESIEGGELHFDHVIKPGQLASGNAIRILEMANFPKEIIGEAKSLAAALGSKSARLTRPEIS